MACSKEALRIILWMSWVSQWLLSSIYVALTLASFSFLWEASTVYLVRQGSNIYTDKTWRAPMATCILSALLVIGFDIFSCVTLVKKSINRAGPGFGYGFIVAFCFCLSFFLLLCGLVLDSFRPLVGSLSSYDWTLNGTQTGDFVWESYNYQTFIGAEVFALINFCTFLIFAVVLVVLQTGVNEQLGIDQAQYAVLDSAPATLPPAYEQPAYGTYTEPDGQYGYTEEQQGLRGAGEYAAPHDTYQSPIDLVNATDYSSQNYQGYGAANQAQASYAQQAPFGQATYGQAGYGQTADYAFENQEGPVAGQQGSGLLGGQMIGTTPAHPPPPYNNYQQQQL